MKKVLFLLLALGLILALPALAETDEDVAVNRSAAHIQVTEATARYSTNPYCYPPDEVIYEISGSTITFSWQPVYLADGYVLREYKNGAWKDLKVLKGGNNTSVKLTGVKNGTHRYGVQTYWFSPSDVRSEYITYGDIKISTKLGKPKVTLTQTGKNAVTVTWSEADNAKKYVVYRSTKKNSGFKKLKTTKSLTYTDKKVTGGKTYYYKVVAQGKVNGKNATKSSAVKKIKVDKNYNAATGVTYRAYLVGNTYPGTASALPGPDRDVNAFKLMLGRMTTSNYKVTAMYNRTAAQILSDITTAYAGADADDVSLFYYSGHGLEGSYGSSNGALCGTSGYIYPSELRAALDKIPGKKVVILDSCFSGAHISKGGQPQAMTKAQLDSFNSAFISAFSAQSKSSTDLAANGYYVITAASQYQSSLSLGISDDVWFGEMTYFLLYGSGVNEIDYSSLSTFEADLNNNGIFTINEVYTYVDACVKEYNNAQSTQYYWPAGGQDQPLWQR